MRKIAIKGMLLSVIVLLAAGCKKEFKSITEENSSPALAERRGHSNDNDCRVTQYYYYDAFHDYEQVDNLTYKNGLVDEWTTFYGYIFKMGYDKHKRMKNASVYLEGELIGTIDFIHMNNKVVKEIWYLGDTKEVEDEVINTYNKKGQLIKNESLNYDYYVINTYTPQGYLESWHFFIGGMPVQKNVYTYKDNNKNPYQFARPGLEYSFGWANSAFGAGNRWYSSEKVFLYDENGNPYVYYDLDPEQTQWKKGQGNLPIRADYVDRINGGTIINSFEYENCGSCSGPSISHRPQKNTNEYSSAKNAGGLQRYRFNNKIVEKLDAIKLKKR